MRKHDIRDTHRAPWACFTQQSFGAGYMQETSSNYCHRGTQRMWMAVLRGGSGS